MRELLTMWRNTRMIVLTALIAAVYAAILIPFKAIPIVPGITEVRVGQVIPPVASLLFGPAAAWGTAFGNLIGDFVGGTFGLGSAFGFIGNFLLGAVPYMMWGRLGPLSSGQEPTMKGGKQLVEFVIVVAASGIACALTIAWGLELLGLFPFTVLGSIIAINNIIVAVILGPVLQGLLYGRVKRWGLIWSDVMEPADIGAGGIGGLGAGLMLVGALAGWGICMAISLGGGNLIFVENIMGQTFNKGGAVNVVLAGAPFMLAMLLALFLGRARTDLTGSGRKAA
jgi:energy-coupling factor transport system substrate-specific component